MTIHRMIFAVPVSLLWLASAPVAANWAWMQDAAISEFTESDWEMLKSEARRVLENEPDKTRVDWTNPETGNGGSIKPLRTVSVEGRTCRKTAFRNVSARGSTGQGTFYMCQQPDGRWVFTPDDLVTPADGP